MSYRTLENRIVVSYGTAPDSFGHPGIGVWDAQALTGDGAVAYDTGPDLCASPEAALAVLAQTLWDALLVAQDVAAYARRNGDQWRAWALQVLPIQPGENVVGQPDAWLRERLATAIGTVTAELPDGGS
jgi:hypothetical protein